MDQNNVQVKVIRLYKPRLSELKHPLFNATKHHSLGTSNAFTLPDTFDALYIGECFRGYISLLNPGKTNMKNVSVAASMQSPSTRLGLLDEKEHVILGTGNKAFTVSYPIQTIGMHLLRIRVSYTMGGEVKSNRKFYRFPVLSPMDMTFRHFSNMDMPCIEATLVNTTPRPLHVHKMAFMPKEEYKLCGLEDSVVDCKDHWTEMLENVEGDVMRPNVPIRKVYQIQHKDDTPIYGDVAFGQFFIEWKTAFGEAGKLESDLIRRSLPKRSALDVRFEVIPKVVPIGIPFIAELCIRNYSNIVLSLQLQMRRDAMKGIFCSSLSTMNLGDVAPNEKRLIPVKLLPLLAGVFDIQGVVVVDLRSSKEHILAASYQVFVQNTTSND